MNNEGIAFKYSDEIKKKHQEDDELWDANQTCNYLKIKLDTLYGYIANTGSRNGKPRKKIPERLYRRIGRRVLFIPSEVKQWVLDGAPMEMNDPKKNKSRS